MNCPNCNELVPDNNYKCPHCGTVIQPGVEPENFRQPARKSVSSASKAIFLVFIVAVAVIIYIGVQRNKNKTAPDTKDTASVTETENSATTSDSSVSDNSGTGSSTGPSTASPGEPPVSSGDSSYYEESGDEEVAKVINESNPGEKVDINNFVKKGKISIFDFYSEYCPPCRQIGPMLHTLDSQRDDIVVMKIDINRPGVTGIDWGSPVIRQYGINSIPHFIIFEANGGKLVGGAAYQKVIQLLQDAEITE